MAWCLPEVSYRTAFDDATGLHDGDAICHMADDGEIMRNEQQAESALAPQAQQQSQDLGATGDIERADGFIADQEPRPHSYRAGNGDTLALSTRQFLWQPRGEISGETDEAQQARDLVVDF